MLSLFIALLAGHALCDFSLQTDFMAKAKNRHTESLVLMWPYALCSHAAIHGLVVTIATGSQALGIAETIAHAAVDFGKNEGWFGFHFDQALHVFCKAAWVACVYKGIA